MMVHMRRMSLVHAKAHLSELVDLAEHKRRPVLILRHGKPAAAIVPVDMVPSVQQAKAARLSDEQIEELWSGFGTGDLSRSAVDDLARSRDRLGGR
jgi:prevent-host-death family protein